MERTTSLPTALSPVGTAAQDGTRFQGGSPEDSVKAGREMGRWVTAGLVPQRRPAKDQGRDGAAVESEPQAVPGPAGVGQRLRAGQAGAAPARPDGPDGGRGGGGAHRAASIRSCATTCTLGGRSSSSAPPAYRPSATT